jgi:hypothetical protein
VIWARRPRARGDLALIALLILTLGLAGTFVHAALAQRQGDRGRDLVTRLGLTDLALLTEARYTRHPSQADRHAAFQDHPGALEHFPSGSLIPPPAVRVGPAHDPLAPAAALAD